MNRITFMLWRMVWRRPYLQWRIYRYGKEK